MDREWQRQACRSMKPPEVSSEVTSFVLQTANSRNNEFFSWSQEPPCSNAKRLEYKGEENGMGFSLK